MTSKNGLDRALSIMLKFDVDVNILTSKVLTSTAPRSVPAHGFAQDTTPDTGACSGVKLSVGWPQEHGFSPTESFVYTRVRRGVRTRRRGPGPAALVVLYVTESLMAAPFVCNSDAG